MDFAGLIVLLVLFGVFLSLVIWTVLNKISPMPTSSKVKKELLKHIPSGIVGNIYELGAGWGTLAFALAHRYPQAKIIGLETSPVPYFFAKTMSIFSSACNLTFKRIDFLNYHLEDAEMVVCYLYPKAMKLLKEKFERELHEGAWVISHTFSVPGWIPYQTFRVKDIYLTPIYIYRFYAAQSDDFNKNSINLNRGF